MQEAQVKSKRQQACYKGDKGSGRQQGENIKSCTKETGNLGSASNSTVTSHGVEFV